MLEAASCWSALLHSYTQSAFNDRCPVHDFLRYTQLVQCVAKVARRLSFVILPSIPAGTILFLFFFLFFWCVIVWMYHCYFATFSVYTYPSGFVFPFNCESFDISEFGPFLEMEHFDYYTKSTIWSAWGVFVPITPFLHSSPSCTLACFSFSFNISRVELLEVEIHCSMERLKSAIFLSRNFGYPGLMNASYVLTYRREVDTYIAFEW